jgi:hypothetical protein
VDLRLCGITGINLTGAAVNLTGVGAGVNLTDALAGSVMDVGACSNLTGSRAGSNLTCFLDLDLLLYLDGSDVAASLALAPADAAFPRSTHHVKAPESCFSR